MRRICGWVIVCASLTWITGCSSVPSAGPVARDVVENSSRDGVGRYVLAPLDEHAITVLAKRPVDTLRGHFGDNRPAPNQVIGVGDVINVTIWEAAAGGLFSAAGTDRLSPGSRSAVIPEQVVSKDGAITVPYAGRIRVVGLTPPLVERAIVTRLAGKAIEPQALVTISRNLSSTATVVGEVTNGARVPLSVKGDRLLDVIATAGGVRGAVHETFVNLSRGSRTATAPLQAVMQQPSENIFVRPGDVLTLVRRPLTFTAFGATGRNAVVPFESVNLTLEEAVAKAAGLLDERADPQGVFVLRYEPVSIVKALDPAWVLQPQERFTPVIYQVNLKDANTYFLARSFQMRDKDIVYVANAPLSEIQKVLGLLQTLTQPAFSAAAVRSAVK